MTSKFLTAAAAALMATVATPAFAQDTGEEKQFDGPYIGVSGGYDVQGNDVGAAIGFDRDGNGTFQDPVTTFPAGADAFSTGYCNGRAQGATRAPQGCENDRNRASYYARIGFDKQMGPFVVGLVGEFGKTEIVDYTSAFSTTPANYVFSRSVDWEASGGVRAGFAADRVLFYGVGKFGYARLDHRFTTTNTQNSFTTIVDDRDRKGFIVGGGVEAKLTRNISIGLEYSYHDYKDSDYKILVGQGTALATNPFVRAPFTTTVLRRQDDNFRWHSLRGTIGFRF
jgi:outer membrane immunogenic protein